MKIVVTYEASAAHLQRLRAVAPESEVVVAGSEEEARAMVADADALLGNRFLLQSLPFATRLRWVQSGSMGVDPILRRAGGRLDGVVLTCARGLYADEVADHAMALLLGVTRGLRSAVESFGARRWDRWSLRTLAGARALVLGWGETGRAIGRRLRAFDVSVQGVRRRHEGAPAADGEGVRVHGPATWRAELPSTDVLLVALPLTAATEGSIGGAELDALAPGAIVVNVGRGAVLDEDALFERLRSGRLGGAGLDTLREEPAGPDHPAWSVPGLLLTPHVGRSLEPGVRRWEPLFEENLRRFVRGEPLLHVVDQAAGY